MNPSVATLGAARPWWRRLALSLGWTALVTGLVIALSLLDRGQLASPPLLDPGELGDWLDQRGAVAAAFAAIRLLALVGAWYLLAVTVLGLVARATRVPRLIELADLGTLPGVRKVLGTMAGVGLGASAATLLAGTALDANTPVARVAGPAVSETAGAPMAIERLPDGSSLVIERLDDADDGQATMRVIDGEAPTGDGSIPTSWTIGPGDHFWHIAEATLTAAWDRPPTDTEITPYWQAVVAANQANLADPANPDLVMPGQTFTLPPPPSPPEPPPAPRGEPTPG